MAICPTHGTEFKFVPAGVSKKTGKPYPGFYACTEYGCKEKPAQDNSSAGQFTKELDQSGAVIDQEKKNKTITRLAIAKSLIEAGKHVPDAETIGIALKWIKWCETGLMDPQEPDIPVVDQDIEIPF